MRDNVNKIEMGENFRIYSIEKMDHMGIPDTLIPTMYFSISMHLAINKKNPI